jgi:hypothetical protein
MRFVLVLAVGSVLSSSVAQAQATRTWVSGVGDDVNPCSRTAPCRTFAGTISKTAAGGEISVLDPGNFGAVTITKSITISGDGTGAEVSASGSNGIVINDSASGTPGTVVVTIRHINLNGNGVPGTPAGLTAINFVSGARLTVDGVAINGFTSGITTSMGHAMVVRTTLSHNSGYGVRAVAGGSSITVEDSALVGNGVAVQADAGTTVRLANNGVYNNLTGFGCGGGTLVSAGNNRKANNVGGSVPACSPTMAMNVQ